MSLWLTGWDPRPRSVAGTLVARYLRTLSVFALYYVNTKNNTTDQSSCNKIMTIDTVGPTDVGPRLDQHRFVLCVFKKYNIMYLSAITLLKFHVISALRS